MKVYNQNRAKPLDDECHVPARKRRKCNNASSNSLEPKSQSASPRSPTVTTLSSYDDRAGSAPANLTRNAQNDFTKVQNNNSNASNIDINTALCRIPKLSPSENEEIQKQKASTLSIKILSKPANVEQQENNQNLSNFSKNHSQANINVELSENPFIKTEEKPYIIDDESKYKYSIKCNRTLRILLDSKRVGGLIGKGGVAITKIRAESHAKILIAKPIPHSVFRICSIEGQICEIVKGIHLIIDKMADESPRLPPYQITLLAEEKNIGALIGKKGNAITQIRQETGAQIYISSHLMRNSSEKTIDISGDRECVHIAVKQVVTRLCDNPCFVPTRILYDPSCDFEQAINATPKSEHLPPQNVQMQSRAHQQQQQPATMSAPMPYNPYYVNGAPLINPYCVQPQIIPSPNPLLIQNNGMYHPHYIDQQQFNANIPISSAPNPNSSNPNSQKFISYSPPNQRRLNTQNRNNNLRHCEYNNQQRQMQQHMNAYHHAIPPPMTHNPYLFNPRLIAENNATSMVLPVAAHLIGGVIGRGGRNIQEIRRQTKAEIKIDNERNGNTDERYITINGTPQQVNSAVYMIRQSLATHT